MGIHYEAIGERVEFPPQKFATKSTSFRALKEGRKNNQTKNMITRK
jgi:hypothetical protein